MGGSFCARPDAKPASTFADRAVRERVSASRSKGLKRIRLCRPEQDVALLAKRQFYYAFRRQVLGLQDHLLVGNGDVVDAQTAAFDLTPRLAIRRHEAGLDERRQHADAGVELAAGNL